MVGQSEYSLTPDEKKTSKYTDEGTTKADGATNLDAVRDLRAR